MEALDAALINLGLSQQDAAHLIGRAGASTVNQWYQGTRGVKAYDRDALCRIVGMTMEEIEALYGVKERGELVKKHRRLFRGLLKALESVEDDDALAASLKGMADPYLKRSKTVESQNNSPPKHGSGKKNKAGGSRR